MRFYHIKINPFDSNDLGGLTPPEYFALCYRITVYDGVVARVIEEEMRREKIQKAIADGQLSGVADTKISGAEYTKQVLSKRKKATSTKESTDLKEAIHEANSSSLYGDMIQFG